MEKFIPPRKGRRHVLRVIREILFFEPRLPRHRHPCRAWTSCSGSSPRRPLWCWSRISSARPTPAAGDRRAPPARAASSTSPRPDLPAPPPPGPRRHDVVAVQVVDRFELELPPLGRLICKDAETGEVLEIDTGDPGRRKAFAERGSAGPGRTGAPVPRRGGRLTSNSAPTNPTPRLWRGSSRTARNAALRGCSHDQRR